MTEYHVPVLVEEILSFVPRLGLMVDGTVGDGGHVEKILSSRPSMTAVGIDRDPVSVARSTARLQPFLGRFRTVTASYADLLTVLTDEELARTSFVLLDLGFSSAQMSNQQRGLSFQGDGPLDMRYDQSDVRLKTAAEIVNRENPHALTQLIREYGEEPRAAQIVRAIVAARDKKPLTKTAELVAVIESVVKRHPKEKLHPATLTFQALRIAVNREFDELERFLGNVVPALPAGCRVGVISFHSLEDRRVKQAFRALAKPAEDIYGERPVPVGRELTTKPIIAQSTEVGQNPRARSAKLRVFERV